MTATGIDPGYFSLNYIGKAELAKNKQASGRPKDLQDLKYLLPSDETQI